MKHPIVQTLLAGGTSTILHILLFLLLIFSFDMPTDIRQFGQPEVEIVQATVVDEDLVLEEMARLQEAEEKKTRSRRRASAKTG
jgi:colicin import membrane protein